MNRFPLLLLEEEGRLNDMPLRENFIERVFAYYRWTQMLDEEPTPGGLVKFHTAHKLTREAVRGLFRAMAHPDPWSGHYPEMARRDAGAAWSQTQAGGTGTS
jgi:hypothetical protein